MTNWTPKKVGDAISVSDRQVRNIAAALGITPAGEKIGNARAYTEAQYRVIRRYHVKNNKPGPNPKKEDRRSIQLREAKRRQRAREKENK